MPRIVLDTSVLAAAFRSWRGASFRLLSRLGNGAFEVVVAVPLIFEYEDVLSREIGLPEEDVSAVVDYICSVAVHQRIFFLWRPVLRDPNDDLVLEIAVAANCETIITHNVRDFDRARNAGVRALGPGAFLTEIGGAK